MKKTLLPFDKDNLAKCMKGEGVLCETTNGEKARILCIDKDSEYPIVAAYYYDSKEHCDSFNISGCHYGRFAQELRLYHTEYEKGDYVVDLTEGEQAVGIFDCYQDGKCILLDGYYFGDGQPTTHPITPTRLAYEEEKEWLNKILKKNGFEYDEEGKFIHLCGNPSTKASDNYIKDIVGNLGKLDAHQLKYIITECLKHL